MAGPWFAVQESNNEWQELGHVWISNGSDDSRGRIEIRLEMVKQLQEAIK